MRSRSAPSATRAVNSAVPVPISALTRGWARRLWYQSGLVGAPPLEANTARPSPVSWYIMGLTRGWPLLAPTVCSSSRGAPSKLPPTLPPLARNSAMILLFQSSASVTVISSRCWAALLGCAVGLPRWAAQSGVQLSGAKWCAVVWCTAVSALILPTPRAAHTVPPGRPGCTDALLLLTVIDVLLFVNARSWNRVVRRAGPDPVPGCRGRSADRDGQPYWPGRSGQSGKGAHRTAGRRGVRPGPGGQPRGLPGRCRPAAPRGPPLSAPGPQLRGRPDRPYPYSPVRPDRRHVVGINPGFRDGFGSAPLG